MNRIPLLITGAIIFASTIMIGAVHGHWTNRWGKTPDLDAAGKLLELLPLTVGDWHAEPGEALDSNVQNMLQCSGNVSRVYENVKTGEQVRIFIVVGPSGPIAVHTPEICYSTKDYSITAPRRKWQVDSSNELWDLRLERTNLSKSPLRVVYGWTNHTQWQAIEQPRFWYGGRPVLYKIQVAGPPPVNEQQDACQNFLSALFPVLKEYLIEAD